VVPPDDPHQPLGATQPERRQEGRRSARATCNFAITEPFGEDAVITHRGQALVLNLSPHGMLLLMDQSPPIHQILEINFPASQSKPKASRFDVCWTRLISDDLPGSACLVGGKILLDRTSS
jgi:hypothetical protein